MTDHSGTGAPFLHAPILDADCRPVAEIVFTKDGETCRLTRSTFINSYARSLSEAEASALHLAALSHDWGALDAFDRELLPWYCRKCARNYAEHDWRVTTKFDPEDGWLDSYRGTCPKHHERMIAD